MKKIIKIAVLTVLIGMPLSIQALTFWDVIAVWLVTKTIEKVAGVKDTCHFCCGCECKKIQCKIRSLKKVKA